MIRFFAQLAVAYAVDAWIRKHEREKRRREFLESDEYKERMAEFAQNFARMIGSATGIMNELTRAVTRTATAVYALAQELEGLERLEDGPCPNCGAEGWRDLDMDSGEVFCLHCEALVENWETRNR